MLSNEKCVMCQNGIEMTWIGKVTCELNCSGMVWIGRDRQSQVNSNLNKIDKVATVLMHQSANASIC